MAKIKINKLPKGFELVDGKIQETKSMAYGGDMRTGDQAEYGLVTTPQNYYGETNFNNSRDENVRYSLSSVPRDNANIEAEGGETVLTDLNDDGSFGLYNITGPRHTKGGVPMFLPEQSFIFSDTPKLKFGKEEMSEFDIKGDKKTPAKISKKFQLNEFYGELDSQYADNISSLSAELMLKKNMNDLSKLAFMQEAKKDFEDGVPLASHPYLLSVDVDPLQFTSQIEQISEEKARQNAIASLSPRQQQELMMMQSMMSNMEQPAQGAPAEEETSDTITMEMPEGNPQGNVGPNEQMELANADQGMMETAMYGTELNDFINRAQDGEETKTNTNPYDPVRQKESYDKLQKYIEMQKQDPTITIKEVNGKIVVDVPRKSRFSDKGGDRRVDLNGEVVYSGDDKSDVPVYNEDIQAQNEVLSASPIGEDRYGIYSGGNRPKNQGAIYNNQIVDGVYKADVTPDKNSGVYAYGTDKLKSSDAKADFMERWGNDISDPNSPMYIEGFDYDADANSPQWAEFQVLAEKTREAEAKELNIPYVPYFKNAGDEGYEKGQGFDGSLGLHTFNTPRADVDLTSGENFEMDLPTDPPADPDMPEVADQPEAEWWAQDINNINTVGAMKDDLLLPFAQDVERQKIDYVLDDYTGAVNANLGAQNTMANALGAYGRQAIDRSNIQGTTLDANAKAINRVNTNNVKTMNQVATLQPQLDMKVDMLNAAKNKQLFDDTNVTLQNAQNFTNWQNAKTNELYNQGLSNRANTANLNSTTDYYDIDPSTGGVINFTEDGRSLYEDNKVDKDALFSKKLKDYQKNNGQQPTDEIVNAFYESVYGPESKTRTKGQNEFDNLEQRGITGATPNNTVNVLGAKRGTETRKWATPFYSGKMGV
tara:strand:+ start:12326 stop:14965 length:2640 start_codon:yes stop_codon:yes gene_type:complete